MGERSLRPIEGVLVPGLVSLHGEITLGSGGALGAGDANPKQRGFTIEKKSGKVGRYIITFQKKYVGIRGFYGVVIGADDAAYPAANGSEFIMRSNNVASAGTIEVQLRRIDTGADAEAINNASLLLTFHLQARKA